MHGVPVVAAPAPGGSNMCAYSPGMPSMHSIEPSTCPYGHRLGPRRMLVGWMPCVCAEAIARFGGHTTVQCDACQEAGVRCVLYDPPHAGEQGGHPASFW